MTYSISDKDSVQILEVNDLLNEYDNNQILLDVKNRIENGLNRFVIDLEHLKFMNSVGLNFLINIMTHSKKFGGDLAVANASDQVVNLLEVTKLKSFFKLTPSVEDALKRLNEN